MYQVLFEMEARKSLKKMDKHQANLILAWILKNLQSCDNPRQFGRPLRYNLQDYWRYRIGNYRVLAEIRDTEIMILIVDIGRRKNIYK
ncbi:type II toxin-antitoxin system RelE family toxin [Macrococcus capreoli]|uniref:type II toxin-antitoxin system RelE family toxin n=1 Tax=Macrococcus capreoli TaxID=2982690 RepID=UPI0021D5F2B3|nr:type II toxin-antitoxin system RelE/ParE family toxin [Macrococcus sp. TMW 2.2395]MCU7557680.1 type II toxin-antitoxin system RelE/ParE family toxin [Macrococcus sp. TMW 2.2395]